MSTPVEWVAYTLTAVSLSTIAAALIYVWCRDPDKDCYCPVCKDVTPRHPKNGCTVCHSTDSFI
jgi:hypothetical protein